MNFLRANNVNVVKRLYDRIVIVPVNTSYELEQEVYMNIWATEQTKQVELILDYDINHKPPKAISISAIQYTKYPLKIKMKLIERGSVAPYEEKIMEGFRTIVKLKPYTSKISFEFVIETARGNSGMVKFSVNHVKF